MQFYHVVIVSKCLKLYTISKAIVTVCVCVCVCYDRALNSGDDEEK